jgi:hypothetical protein
MLHDIEEGDGEDDEGHQFYDLPPASLAPLPQANGEDDHRNGDDEEEQRGHSLESTSTPLGSIGGPHATQVSGVYPQSYPLREAVGQGEGYLIVACTVITDVPEAVGP